MSNHLAIATVTAALRRTLLEAVATDVNGATVTNNRPDASRPHPAPTVNVFLYQTTPNTAWRGADLPTRGAGGHLARRPQAAFDLHYLLTFYGEESTLEPQRLLGSVVRRLHERPVLTRKLLESTVADPSFSFLAASDLAEETELVKLAPSALSLEELSKLWSVFFQTPYVLSVAYQGSVVLIDGTETPLPGLPVRTRHIEVGSFEDGPFRQPLIETVTPEGGAGEPLLVTSRLHVRGRRLRGQGTRVQIGTAELEPEKLKDDELVVNLGAQPPDSLRAGVQAVRVLHDGPASNAAAVVLRPTLVSVSMEARRADRGKRPHPRRPIPPPVVTVEIRPPVGKDQQTILLLRELPDGELKDREPKGYILSTPPRDEDGDVIDLSVAGVAAGRYLASVQVDGAESPLETDPKTQRFVGLEVTVR